MLGPAGSYPPVRQARIIKYSTTLVLPQLPVPIQYSITLLAEDYYANRAHNLLGQVKYQGIPQVLIRLLQHKLSEVSAAI